jgi:hypothetical protein
MVTTHMAASDPFIVFPDVVRNVLTRTAVSYELEQDEKRRRWTVRVPQRSERGFDAGLICEPYGIYPWAHEWHGVPWDFGPHWTARGTCETAVAFLQRLISPDARVRVLTSAGKPYRWILELRDGDAWKLYEETGLLLYNFFGSRSERILTNRRV